MTIKKKHDDLTQARVYCTCRSFVPSRVGLLPSSYFPIVSEVQSSTGGATDWDSEGRREPTHTSLLVMVVHVSSREPHRLDRFIERDRVNAVASQGQLRSGDGFDRTERVSLDARHLDEPKRRVTSQAVEAEPSASWEGERLFACVPGVSRLTQDGVLCRSQPLAKFARECRPSQQRSHLPPSRSPLPLLPCSRPLAKVGKVGNNFALI